MSESPALSRRDIPLYRQLDAVLRDQIFDGRLRPGDRLPTEAELCSHYGVSRATVRQALEALDKDGLLDRSAGRGTFLREIPDRFRAETLRSRHPWRAVVEADAARAGTEIRFGTALPPPVVARELMLGPEAETPFFIRVLTDAAGPRVALKRYLRPDLAPVLETGVRRARDFPAALAQATGRTVACSSFWVEAILTEPRFAMMLKVPLGSPLLSIWWVETLDGRQAVCTQMLQPGPRVSVGLVP